MNKYDLIDGPTSYRLSSRLQEIDKIVFVGLIDRVQSETLHLIVQYLFARLRGGVARAGLTEFTSAAMRSVPSWR